jgi:hypothetical protein
VLAVFQQALDKTYLGLPECISEENKRMKSLSSKSAGQIIPNPYDLIIKRLPGILIYRAVMNLF